MTTNIMNSTRRPIPLNFTTPLVLEPPRHSGLTSIPLVPGRHLIGSAPECAIRICVEGILDRHALILVGENRTVIKSMDSRTWVNDGPVAEMALRPGDRLSIGPLTFRVRSATTEEAEAFVIMPKVESETQRVDSQTSAREIDPVDSDRPSAHLVPARHPMPGDAATTDRSAVQLAEGGSVQNQSGTGSIVKVPGIKAPVVKEIAAQADLSDQGPSDSRYDAKSGSPAGPVIARALQVGSASGTSDRAVLDSRLEEIQRQLTELRISTDSVVQPVEPEISLVQAEIAHRSHQMDLRAQELQRRADQVTAETQRLQARADHVSARESQLDLRQHQLVQEAERIAEVTQSARRSLAEEHAQHVAIWQEWEAAYLRMTGEIASQLDAIEQHRESLQVEADRLTVARAELQRMRAQQEHDRQLYAVDQIKLASDRAELASLRSELERQRELQRHDADEVVRQREASQREVTLRQEELASAIEQLECERQTLMADWSEQVKRIELENQRRAAAKLALDDDRQRLQNERDELSTLKDDLARQQTLLDLDRSQMELARIDAQRLLIERQCLEERCQQADVELAELRRIEAEYSKLLMTRAIDLPDSADNSGHGRSSPVAPGLDIPASPILLSANVLQTASAPIENPTPIAAVPSFPDASGGFGLAVDWSTLVAKEHEFACAMSDVSASVPEREPVAVEVRARDRSSETADTRADWLMNEAAANLNTVAAVTHPRECPTGDLESNMAAVLTSSKVDAAMAAVDPWGVYAPQESAAPANRQFVFLGSEEANRLANELVVGSSIESGASSFSSVNSDFDSAFPEQVIDRPDEAAHGLTADETLTEVNRQFGMPVEESPTEPALAMPSWWVESPSTPVSDGQLADEQLAGEQLTGDAEPSSTVQDEPSLEMNDDGSVVSVALDPVDELRAKLAAMFDLPGTTSSDTARENASANPNEFGVTTRDDSEELPDPPRTLTLAEVRPHAANANVASDTPATTTVSGVDTHVEDSVETFMARLLARSRTGSDEPSTPAAQPAAAQGSSGNAVRRESEQRIMDSMEPKVAATDRSHLMEEPKHKQDRQAVRENLQSFRQVAHMSARSALARHSLEQLRNATIAKGVLLAVSAAAVSYFLAQPMWGGPVQLWKSAGCALATLLAAMEFNRSWSRLMTPVPATAELTASAEPDASVDQVASADQVANVDTADEQVSASGRLSEQP